MKTRSVGSVASLAPLVRQIRQLSSAELARQTEILAEQEPRQGARLIAHLAEVASRRLHLELRYRSLFEYCTKRLGLTEGCTALRIQVSRVCGRHPPIQDALAGQQISLTVAGKLAPHLTSWNLERCIADCTGMKKREVEEYLVHLAPKPVVSPGVPFDTLEPRALHRGLHRDDEADKAFMDKLACAAEVSSVGDTGRDTAQIFERILDASLQQHDPRQRQERREKKTTRKALAEAEAAARKVTAGPVARDDDRQGGDDRPGGARSRTIPTSVRDRLLIGAGQQCEYTSSEGLRCSERSHLAIDHIVSWGIESARSTSTRKGRPGGHQRPRPDEVANFGRVRECPTVGRVARRACGARAEVATTAASTSRFNLLGGGVMLALVIGLAGPTLGQDRKNPGAEAKAKDSGSRAQDPKIEVQDPELKRLLEQAEHEANQGLASQVKAKGGPGWLSAFNPRLTLFGDFDYQYASRDVMNAAGEKLTNRFSLREVELDARADIDPSSKAIFIISYGEESPGVYTPDIEEGYASFETLPHNLGMQVGKFRPHVGLDNRLHTHDLPYTDRPLVVRELLGDEGWSDVGARLNWRSAVCSNSTLDLSVAALNGEGATVLSGAKSNGLAQMARAELFTNLGAASFLQVGTNVVSGSSTASGGKSLLVSADALFKWRPAAQRDLHSLVFETEFYYLDRDILGAPIHSKGGYATLLWQLDQSWYIGARGDATEFAAANRGSAWGVSAWLSYYTSEFLRVRGGIEYTDDPRGVPDTQAFVQMTFVMGSHPSEPFWVNR